MAAAARACPPTGARAVCRSSRGERTEPDGAEAGSIDAAGATIGARRTGPPRHNATARVPGGLEGTAGSDRTSPRYSGATGCGGAGPAGGPRTDQCTGAASTPPGDSAADRVSATSADWPASRGCGTPSSACHSGCTAASHRRSGTAPSGASHCGTTAASPGSACDCGTPGAGPAAGRSAASAHHLWCRDTWRQASQKTGVMVVRTPPWGVHFNAPRRHAFRNPISKAHRLIKVFTLRISELQPRFRARIRETGQEVGGRRTFRLLILQGIFHRERDFRSDG